MKTTNKQRFLIHAKGAKNSSGQFYYHIYRNSDEIATAFAEKKHGNNLITCCLSSK